MLRPIMSIIGHREKRKMVYVKPGGRISPQTANALFLQGKRYCSRCKQVKLLDAFGLSKGHFGGRDYYCRECKRIYNRKRARDRDRLKVAPRRREVRLRYSRLLGGKCIRCGYVEFPIVLEPHHINPAEKEINISIIVARVAARNKISDQRVIDELDKCALLCRNCHQAYHVQEWQGTWKKRDGLGWELEKEGGYK